MSRRVEYTEFGGPEVLHVVEVEEPHPGPGEIRVRVRTAGLNPFDTKVFRGLPTQNPQSVTFPQGNGGEFAGSVDELGEGVTTFAVGDLVMGSRGFSAQADYLITPAERVIAVPEGLPIEIAGSLDTAGRTAWASVAVIAPGPQDTVLVSAAAGGVGVIAVQLLLRAGATVIGTASVENHEFLRGLGVIPVEYGPEQAQQVRAVAPNGITAALDNIGHGFVAEALALGAAPERVNTIAEYSAPKEFGVHGVGGAAAGLDELAQLAALVVSGEIVVPIDSVYPLEDVTAAYQRLLGGHLRGKIVLAVE